MAKLPRLVRFLLVATAVNVAVLGLLRIAFWLAFADPADPLADSDLLHALYLGTKFDLRTTLVFLLPLALLGGVPWFSPFRHRIAQLFWTGYLSLVTLFTGLFYALDFGHYAYLKTRVDNTVLRFLENLDISMAMVWESYPVVWITLGLAAATAFFAWGVQRLFRAIAAAPAAPLRWRGKALTMVLSFFAILAGLYGKVSWYPLRWSDAHFSTHAFAAAVAVNPVHYFLDTRKNGGVRYDENKVREHYPAMAAWLGVSEPDPQALRFLREVTPALRPASPPNVVVVQLESFASYKTSLSGNPLDPTPNFARVAREGLYFNNFFVPHTGTARAVFATATGIPDVELNGTSTRNPVIVSQHTVIDDFRDYEKLYFLGGSASWGNIRGLLSRNIPGLQLFEEGSYASPRVDVWGISDLSLFEEASQVLGRQEKPFFAYIQTSGGHRPYTIPEHNRGFEPLHPGQDQVRQYGFDSEEEFNSFRFLDHALGWFMAEARKAPWYDNTLFVFFGDHGLGGSTGRHMPASEAQLELGSFRVPFVIHAPGLIAEPAVIEKVASQVDVLPTVAGLAGRPYRIATLGRDLLDPRFDQNRYAFTIAHGSRTIGLIGDGFVFRMHDSGREARLYRIGEEKRDLAAEYPEQFARMRELTTALHETAKYLLHHNARPE